MVVTTCHMLPLKCSDVLCLCCLVGGGRYIACHAKVEFPILGTCQAVVCAVLGYALGDETHVQADKVQVSNAIRPRYVLLLTVSRAGAAAMDL